MRMPCNQLRTTSTNQPHEGLQVGTTRSPHYRQLDTVRTVNRSFRQDARQLQYTQI